MGGKWANMQMLFPVCGVVPSPEHSKVLSEKSYGAAIRGAGRNHYGCIHPPDLQ